MAVPPVLSDLVSAPNAPNRSGRGGRDRRSKFYELPDNLAGNLQSVSRPLTSTGQTQTTSYTYGNPTHPGDVTAITDPNLKKSTLSYDAAGDLASSTDPLGNETTYSYTCSGTPAVGCFSNIGLLYREVAPRGNAVGATPANFTTASTCSALGQPLTVTNPLGHTATYVYDLDGNQTSVTDPAGNATTSTYNAAYITLSLQAGKDLVFVQTQAGHADWKTTLDIYTQQSQRSIEPEIRRLLQQLLGDDNDAETSSLHDRRVVL
jgi:YD repeat-containing protein